jgi:hypothetical protein
VIVTRRFVIVPVRPLTLNVLGYGVAFPSLMVIAAPLYVLTEGLYGFVTIAFKVVGLPLQTFTSAPAFTVGGRFTVTANVLTVLLPQILFAVTLIFPLLAPTVVVIEVVVEVPVQPDGKVQV